MRCKAHNLTSAFATLTTTVGKNTVLTEAEPTLGGFYFFFTGFFLGDGGAFKTRFSTSLKGINGVSLGSDSVTFFGVLAMSQLSNHVGGLLERMDKYPEHIRIVGLIVTDWSALEGRLSILLWAILRSAAHGSAVFYALGSGKARLDILRALALEVLSGEIRKETISALEAITAASNIRNIIVHGQWGIPYKGGPDPFVQVQKSAAKVKSVSRIYTVSELQAIDDKITAVDKRIGQVTIVIQMQYDKAIAKHFNDLRTKFPKFDTYLKRFE